MLNYKSMTGEINKDSADLTPEEKIVRAKRIGEQVIQIMGLTDEQAHKVKTDAGVLFSRISDRNTREALTGITVARAIVFRGPDGKDEVLDEARTIIRILGENPDNRFRISRITYSRLLSAVREGNLQLPQLEHLTHGNVFIEQQ